MKDTPQPFIPGWLDELGLDSRQFRVLCHLWRRGETHSTAATIATVCRIKRETIFGILAELEARGLIDREPRQGKTTLIRPVPQNGTGPMPDPSPKTGHPVSPETDHHPSPKTGHKGNPLKAIPSRLPLSEVSTDALEFADWFRSTLPAAVNLPANWRTSFAGTFDALVKLDSRDPSEIRKVSAWARSSDFWQSNFMSPAKLRKRNPDGILYFDVFAERIKSTPPMASQQEGRGW